jgi:hypothetical protein
MTYRMLNPWHAACNNPGTTTRESEMSWVISVGQSGPGGKKQVTGKPQMLVLMADGAGSKAKIKVTQDAAGSPAWQVEQTWEKLLAALVGIE